MKRKTVSIFLLLLFHFSIKAQVNIGDSLALVDLYHSTNGSAWKNNSNWLNSRVSEWFGVKVTNNRVTGLYLVNNQLNGTLPASLGNLTELSDLYLSSNNLSGTIPNSIGNLSALAFLYLSHNKLEGNIPATIGNATALRELYLQHNKLTGEIPVSLKSLYLVREVVLAYNQLTGDIPKVGGILVQRLELNDNQLSGSIPATLQNIRDLKILKLNNNQLTGEIPLGLISTACYSVDLSSNRLTGSIPSDIGNNGTLAHVNLSNNELTGQIPSTISNMTGLQSLELDSNHLSGDIPSSFSRLDRLYRLNLMNNQLSGSIPNDLCSLPDLEFLGLSNNQFTFDGMECVGSKQHNSMLVDYAYKNQKTLTLNFKDLKISLSAGGSLPNNTYYIYKDDELLETVKGDSTFTVSSEGGKYRVEVTNDKADQLTLYSNTIDVSSSIILPLEWLSFTAVSCADNVCLQWETTNEQNTSHFEIERSTDGNNFTKIGTRASYNTPGKHSYGATDYTPVNGLSFYRIKQLDQDGVYSYSSIASIRTNAKEILTITPNPANDFIVLSGISKANAVSIYDMEGKLLRRWSNVNGNQQLNIANLRQGIYIIKVLLNNKEDAYKLVKY